MAGPSTAEARPPGPLDEPVEAVAELVDDTGIAEPVACDSQRLVDGVQLPERPELYIRWHADRSWGRPELVEVITEAAEEVAWRLPHADPFVVGDMSSEHGGLLHGHRSHRGGQDADLGLYFGEGRQNLKGFIDVRPADLDVVATWTFIEAMLATGLVERILLDRGHIRRLRRYVIDEGLLSEEEAWATFPAEGSPDLWRRDGVVQHVSGHRNHIHLRVRCAD